MLGGEVRLLRWIGFQIVHLELAGANRMFREKLTLRDEFSWGFMFRSIQQTLSANYQAHRTIQTGSGIHKHTPLNPPLVLLQRKTWWLLKPLTNSSARVKRQANDSNKSRMISNLMNCSDRNLKS